MVESIRKKVWQEMETPAGDKIKVNISDNACGKFSIKGVSLKHGDRFYDHKILSKGTIIGVTDKCDLCLSLDEHHGKVLPFDFPDYKDILNNNFVLIKEKVEDKKLCQKEELQNGKMIWLRRSGILSGINLPNENWSGVGIISMDDEKEKKFHILLPDSNMEKINHLFEKEEFPRCTLSKANVVFEMYPYSMSQLKSDLGKKENEAEEEVRREKKTSNSAIKKFKKLQKENKNMIKLASGWTSD